MILNKLATALGRYACKMNQHDYEGRESPYADVRRYLSSQSTGSHEIDYLACKRCGDVSYFVPLKEHL